MVTRDSVEPRWLRSFAQFFFQLVLALVQGLQTQFPAMKLNAQLIDVAGHFGPLRFILLQFPLQVGEFLRQCRAGGHRRHRDGRRFATALAIQRHSGGGGVNNERTGAMLTLEKEVAMFAFCLRTNRVHHSVIKQRLYQPRGAQALAWEAGGYLARRCSRGFSGPRRIR
jgi:hypothetical protein